MKKEIKLRKGKIKVKYEREGKKIQTIMKDVRDREINELKRMTLVKKERDGQKIQIMLKNKTDEKRRGQVKD